MLRKLALAIAAALAVAQASSAATIVFVVPLSGAEEVPGPGDPDGSGTATLTIDDVANTISWEIVVSNLDAVIAAHIHTGAVGVAGAPVIDFSGQLTGSSLFDADLAAVLANPAGFYVNVHTTCFQGGAIRGQLAPEPAALALLSVGALALAFARRRLA